ncbi:S8 family serine peptidase [Streptomyces sp. MST-110588]|nr:S8 family peptidase [Streptomyces sp. MST-110588]UNO43869.1 S8 family serine peptidase [Streptomyces sp. MST-110588]
MTATPSSAQQRERDAAGSATAATTTASGTTATAAAAKRTTARHWITLITGDRIAVDAKGNPLSVRRAPDRTHIPIQIRRAAGHLYAIPLDAQRLIRERKVDQRLFDLTLLSRAEYRRTQSRGLRLIVGYQGGDPKAKKELHATGDAEVRRTFGRLNAEAVTADRQRPVKVWEALTDESAAGTERTATPGLSRLWLDSVRTVRLDKSVPQIGAPKAWKAGYDGKGSKIAVLDTGVDQGHPDLATQEIAEKNFSASPDNKDRFGHGTHVASIAAGTGAKSHGKYRGVAPGARLLDGKVLDDEGFGEDSGIIAGMEWAAAQKADVVNLSLGGQDAPGIDPLEEAVNRLSRTGTLFVVAAGNSGPQSGTIDTPGSADAALTVGAVDKKDRLAEFSSTGPRVGDGAIKPDLTAPGVNIAAAAAPGSIIAKEGTPVADGYVAISGTSMATPHVAGSAAILKQQHPAWTGQRIKAALTASTTPHRDYTPFQQGTGRVDVGRAIKQTVVAEPGSLNFGIQSWPHSDDKPVTKQLTYRNLGKKAVRLDLALSTSGPGGKPAPAGMFRLGVKSVNVPAGGTAEVPLTADTRPGGTRDGAYTAYLVATGGGQTVRAAAAVIREVESYDITLKHLGRDGRPVKLYNTGLVGISGLGKDQTFAPYDASGTVKVRVPKGRYILTSLLPTGTGDEWKGGDWIAAPRLEASKNMTVTVDARTAEPIDVTVPDRRAQQTNAYIDFETGDGAYGFGMWLDTFKGLRTAHLGAKVNRGDIRQQVIADWTQGSPDEYSIAYGFRPTTLLTGFTKHVTAKELAKVSAVLGSSVKGAHGWLTAMPHTGSSSSTGVAADRALPHTSTAYVNAGAVKWQFLFDQVDPELGPVISYTTGEDGYQAGKNYRHVFNVGVVGPQVGKNHGLYREGDKIYGALPLFADGQGHLGDSVTEKVTTTLYRNGVKIGTNDDPLTGAKPFTVPAGQADYRLTTAVTRSTKYAAVSTRILAEWTFTSAHTTTRTALPASTVRYTPELAADSTAKAGATVRVPVTVQGPAAGSGAKPPTVSVSYDGGRTWQKASVGDGKITVRNPAAGQGISFKAEVTDKKGNTLKQTVINAYLGK